MGRVEAVAAQAPETRPARWIAVPVVAGALVALTVGLLARRTDGTASRGYFQLFFSDPIHLKAWFATLAAVGACIQLFLAAWIFRKLPWPRPAWVPGAHRW